jgi:stage V sporulation protein G
MNKQHVEFSKYRTIKKHPPLAFLEYEDAGLSTVLITVLSVTPVRAGKLFAFASVEIDLDGVRLEIHGIRAIRVEPISIKIQLPTYRDATGVWRPALTLPEEMHGPIGDIVLDALIDCGLAVKRTASNIAAAQLLP